MSNGSPTITNLGSDPPLGKYELSSDEYETKEDKDVYNVQNAFQLASVKVEFKSHSFLIQESKKCLVVETSLYHEGQSWCYSVKGIR
jgi:hypothetical protein